MTGARLYSQKSIWVVTMLFSTTLFGLATAAAGQSQTAVQSQPAAQQGAPAMATSFEVVSVKPAKSGCDMYMRDSPGRWVAHCVTLWGLIYNAYQVRSFRDHPPGLPKWGDSARFDVDAKADDQTTMAMQKLPRGEQGKQAQLMRQSLLADRFHLRVHYESRIEPIYELVIAKGGPKVKQLPADQNSGGWSEGRGAIRMHGQPIAALAFTLSQVAGRMVTDKTGLAGRYDIDLKWTPDDQQDTPDAGPTLLTALQEQLGLKLEPATGPVQTLIVDHAEQPSAN